MGGKCQNSNVTFSMIFKHCAKLVQGSRVGSYFQDIFMQSFLAKCHILIGVEPKKVIVLLLYFMRYALAPRFFFEKVHSSYHKMRDFNARRRASAVLQI